MAPQETVAAAAAPCPHTTAAALLVALLQSVDAASPRRR